MQRVPGQILLGIELFTGKLYTSSQPSEDKADSVGDTIFNEILSCFIIYSKATHEIHSKLLEVLSEVLCYFTFKLFYSVVLF